MENTYWLKQSPKSPLFPELLWSRPENRSHAGKLLIVGGNLHGFAAPAEAYAGSLAAGAGSIRVLLPLAIKNLAGKLLPDIEYAASTPSGSFASSALSELLDQSNWADAVLLAGDLGRNSETAVLVEAFVEKYTGQLTLTQDTVDYFRNNSAKVLNRANTCMVLSFEQLQKLATNVAYEKAFTLSMGLVRAVEVLHEFSQVHLAHIITKLDDTIIVASEGKISTTTTDSNHEIWRVKTAATASVWWLQNPLKPFESITTSINGAEGGT